MTKRDESYSGSNNTSVQCRIIFVVADAAFFVEVQG